MVVIKPLTTPMLSCSGLTMRRQAVGGADGIGDHRVRGLQHVVVHAVDDGGVDVLAAGRRNDHFLRAAVQVRAGLVLAGEQAGAFQHHVDAEVLPRQLGGVALRAAP